MKPLFFLLAVLGLCPASAAPWWNPAWPFRRSIAITNHLDRALEKGFTLHVEIDPDYLGIRGKSKPGFEDWRLVRGAETVPFLVQPGKGKAVVLCFRTAENIPARGSDSYHLYFGNSGAEAERAARDQVYEMAEDFSRPETLALRFAADPDLTAEVRDGALVIRDVAAGRTPHNPARIAFRNFPPLAGFELAFDLEVEPGDGAGPSFAATIDLQEPGLNDPSLGKKAEELIAKLGDDDWESREKATKALIAMGRPAAAKLTEATRSTDAEVKWRADHILREIRERSPAPVISAGVSPGEGAAGAMLSSMIGKSRARTPHRTGWPVRTRITIQREPEGDVTVLWNGRAPQSGHLEGAIAQVAFTASRAGGSPLGTIRIDNIVVRRYVDEESRPTSEIGLEEPAPK